ncbi:Hypothetical predicted protein [Mytilus galloprovincialis]|uniref:Myb/SANT-like DNA-binding domain-containing protein n=1 Tax=Mytilus galloprovincialis TaxID=29158 RepID=A0A8B6E026_MYTGA|nr:Hypothetical predicted protein [Mytilus galloprovincialis]
MRQYEEMWSFRKLDTMKKLGNSVSVTVSREVEYPSMRQYEKKWSIRQWDSMTRCGVSVIETWDSIKICVVSICWTVKRVVGPPSMKQYEEMWILRQWDSIKICGVSVSVPVRREINVLQDEVEKNYAVINDKFGSAVTNKRKTAVWGSISIMVSFLGVVHRSAKECKDKWANTKKEAKKIFSVKKRDYGKTGGGPQGKPVSVAVNRTTDLCKDSASFKGIGGVESCIIGLCHEVGINRSSLLEAVFHRKTLNGSHAGVM